MFRLGSGEAGGDVPAVNDKNQANQEEQLQKLVNERVKKSSQWRRKCLLIVYKYTHSMKMLPCKVVMVNLGDLKFKRGVCKCLSFVGIEYSKVTS